MTTITSGTVTDSKTIYNDSQPCLQVTINGNSISGYNNSYPVINPAGFFSVPMPGKAVIVTLMPYGTSGFVSGFMNESPEEDNNITGLIAGESAISETSTYNFNIQAKLDGLKSIFINNDTDIITTNLAISENVVTILTDIIDEIKSLEQNYNALITKFNNFNTIFMAHTHGGVEPGGGISLGTTTNFPNNPTYTAISNFNRDDNFINESPSQMYININGKVIT